VADIIAAIILLGGAFMFGVSLLYARAVLRYREEMRSLVARLEQSKLGGVPENLPAEANAPLYPRPSISPR